MNNQIPRYKKVIFFWNWKPFEKFILLLNWVLATIFFILGFTVPMFINPDSHPFGGTCRGWVLNVVSYLGNIFNFLSIIISTRKHISNFFFGFIGCIFLGISSLLLSCNGNAILYVIFYLPAQVTGFILWKRSANGKKTIEPYRKLYWWENLILWSVVIGATIGFMFIDKIPNFQIFMNGGAIKPPYDSQVLLWMRYFVDSAGLIVGMCAMIMMLLRVREQWFLWLIIDIVTLILHCIVTNTQMICAFAVSLINAFYGIITWGVFKKK